MSGRDITIPGFGQWDRFTQEGERNVIE